MNKIQWQVDQALQLSELHALLEKIENRETILKVAEAKAELLGELLLYTYATISKTTDFTAPTARQRQDAALKSLSLTVPKLDLGEVTEFPKLGPFQGEILLEGINRVNNLLHSLQFVLAPSGFKAVFEQARVPFADDKIGEEHMPKWMNKNGDLPPPSLENDSQLSHNNFILIRADAKEAEYKALLDSHMIDVKSEPSRQPRATAEEIAKKRKAVVAEESEEVLRNKRQRDNETCSKNDDFKAEENTESGLRIKTEDFSSSSSSSSDESGEW
ncbi:hypothetical protein MMC14_002610 [Varicellaria rhodocarpa]|nr:hypothetical protein [Varicellaria rhodocarpa]